MERQFCRVLGSFQAVPWKHVSASRCFAHEFRRLCHSFQTLHRASQTVLDKDVSNASYRRTFSTCAGQFPATTPSTPHAPNVASRQQSGRVRIGGILKDQNAKRFGTLGPREDSRVSDASKRVSAKPMTKGKLLTTPSRLLKLIIPLSPIHQKSTNKDIEPLALLVHPRQPLSYLERLIQTELPLVQNPRGQERAPCVYFRAKDPGDQSLGPIHSKLGVEEIYAEGEGADLEATEIDGDLTKTGKLNRISGAEDLARSSDGHSTGPSHGRLQSSDNTNTTTTGRDNFVRWAGSTEIGDFIRDAAQSSEFEIEVEGSPEYIVVGVPSFNERTHYLRMRLRRLSRTIVNMATVKTECDMAAHKGARQVAMGGFGLLVGWWYMVYWLTFKTSSGWDFVEPVTYLVGLTTVMGGYLWFLYNNREASYRAALNLTVNRRQNKLYQARDFDIAKWEALVDEANTLRKEIKVIANEYDVDWDEKADVEDEMVTDVLKAERKKKGRGRSEGGGADKRDEDV